MVLIEARARLGDALSDLIRGQMTNDQFDDLYYPEWQESPDRAITAIAEFGWGLYSSDLLWPYRVAGRYALDSETLRVAERCLLFLRTDLEYRWPERPSSTCREFVGGGAIFRGIPLGVAMLIVSALLLATVSVLWFLYLAVPGGMVLAVSLVLLRWSHRQDSPQWQEFRAAGDYEVWPFLQREECGLADESRA